ncbi:hypothetical protein AK830_g10992, partial [Neonectria ditissima]
TAAALSYGEQIDEIARELVIFPESEDSEAFTVFRPAPEQEHRLVNMLQTGLLDNLIREIRSLHCRSRETEYIGNDMYALLVLTCMHLGVKMKTEYILHTRALSYRFLSPFHHLQAQTACQKYKNNGTPWIFENKNARDIARRATGKSPDGVGNGAGHSADEGIYIHCLSRTCTVCGEKFPRHVCGSCNMIRYCSTKCVESDKPWHQFVCSQQRALKDRAEQARLPLAEPRRFSSYDALPGYVVGGSSPFPPGQFGAAPFEVDEEAAAQLRAIAIEVSRCFSKNRGRGVPGLPHILEAGRTLGESSRSGLARFYPQDFERPTLSTRQLQNMAASSRQGPLTSNPARPLRVPSRVRRDIIQLGNAERDHDTTFLGDNGVQPDQIEQVNHDDGEEDEIGRLIQEQLNGLMADAERSAASSRTGRSNQPAASQAGTRSSRNRSKNPLSTDKDADNEDGPRVKRVKVADGRSWWSKLFSMRNVFGRR